MTRLDDKGRCCGRKPLDYKTGRGTSGGTPQKFCTRCSRAFNRETGEQIENWAWVNAGGVLVQKQSRFS